MFCTINLILVGMLHGLSIDMLIKSQIEVKQLDQTSILFYIVFFPFRGRQGAGAYRSWVKGEVHPGWVASLSQA